MKVSFLIIFLTLTKGLVVAQQVVDVTVVDSKGVSKTIKTNKPDTVMKKAMSKQIMIDAGSGSEPIFRSKRDSLSYLVLENHIAAANRVYSVPDNIGKLSLIRELYLHDNRLISIPESIGKLTSLKVLRINNNLLTHLPESLINLTALENIDFSNNSISTLPIGLQNYTNLKILAMVNNPWEESTKDTVVSMAKELRKRNVVVHLNSYEIDVEE